MAPPAATTASTKSTGEAEVSAENGSANEKNLSLTSSPLNKIEKVVVHPLVLLSVVDHYNRMGKIGNSQRVVGILLGSLKNKILDVSNSFARRTRRSFRRLVCRRRLVLPLVPFDEEDKEKDVWFLDHEYLENMYTMFRKVNGKHDMATAVSNTLVVDGYLQLASGSLAGIIRALNCNATIFPSMN